MKAFKKKKHMRKAKMTKPVLDIYTEPTKCSENANNCPEFDLPANSQNRVGRWTHSELVSLKTAMTIFGDQSWKKI